MKIFPRFNAPLNINNKYNKETSNTVQHPLQQAVSNPLENRNVFAYNDHNISFGARLNRTPEDFYAQKFNQENMPATVKNYLNEDYEERQHMPPSQLQREAFEYIKIADNVKDVKEMYPDEQLFKDLRPFSETNSKRGTLLLLRWDAQTSQTPVFKDKEEKDLSLYLLKKVYIEGKTLEEINKDFADDATDEIKNELGNQDGDFFTYADLKSMGIKYPNMAYYQSFLATRDDKEYVPASRKSSGPRTISEEHLQKMQEGRKSWWEGLDKTDRDEQVQKMINGKEFANSTFSRYQGQIMTIAAAKIGFGEKLAMLYEERYYDKDFQDDFDTFKERQRAIMQEFWNKDPEFKKVYSDAIQSTIADFDTALADTENPGKLEALMNRALDLKAKVLENAKKKRHERLERQKLAPKPPVQQPKPSNGFDINSKKEIIKLFRQQENAGLRYYPDMFRKEILDYIVENTDFRTKQICVALSRPDAQELLATEGRDWNEQEKELVEEVQNKIEEINQKFNMSHVLTAQTNDHIMNNLLFELTGSPLFFKCERGDTHLGIQKNNLGAEVTKNKEALNKQMKQLARPLTDKDAKDYFDNTFMPRFNQIIKTGFKYYPQISDIERNGIKSQLNNALLSNPENMKKCIKFISNCNAPIKFLKNNKNPQEAKDVVFEKMAFDFMFWFLSTQKQDIKKNTDELLAQGGKAILPKTAQPSAETKTPEKSQQVLDISDVDFNSMESLKKAFRKVSKKQCQFFSNDFTQKLNDFLLSHPDIRKEVLIAFVLIETKAIDSLPEIQLNEQDKEALALIAEHTFIKTNKDFDKKYPILAQSNEFAVNQALFEITKNPEMFKNTRADSALYILNNNLEERMKPLKPSVEKHYNDYSSGLNDKDIKKFFSNNFSKTILEINKNGLKYHDDIKKDASDKMLALIFEDMKLNREQEIKFMFDFLKRYKGAVKFIADQRQPQEARDLLNEHIVYDYICEKAENYYKDTNK